MSFFDTTPVPFTSTWHQAHLKTQVQIPRFFSSVERYTHDIAGQGVPMTRVQKLQVLYKYFGIQLDEEGRIVVTQIQDFPSVRIINRCDKINITL